MKRLALTLMKDLRAIGINEDFELRLKKYSKSYFGRYDPNNNRVVLYVYRDSEGLVSYPYRDLLLTLIHESIHCIQWNNPDFVRYHGVMHDDEFYRLYNFYSGVAESYLLLKGVRGNAPILKKSGI